MLSPLLHRRWRRRRLDRARDARFDARGARPDGSRCPRPSRACAPRRRRERRVDDDLLAEGRARHEAKRDDVQLEDDLPPRVVDVKRGRRARQPRSRGVSVREPAATRLALPRSTARRADVFPRSPEIGEEVARVVGEEPGVTSAKATALTGSLLVTYDPRIIQLPKLVQTLIRLGGLHGIAVDESDAWRDHPDQGRRVGRPSTRRTTRCWRIRAERSTCARSFPQRSRHGRALFLFGTPPSTGVVRSPQLGAPDVLERSTRETEERTESWEDGPRIDRSA